MRNEIELLLTSEAAREAVVSAATIRAWLRSGRLPALRTSTGVHLIRRADLVRVLEARGR
jgi:excisionase family DNA binding protein